MPFRAGQRVEMVMIAAADDDRAARIEELQALFRSTQALPQAKAITEEMIAEAIRLGHLPNIPSSEQMD